MSCRNDRIVFNGTSPARVRRALRGARVEAVHRRGKHLWFELDARPWPLFHFGMTGAFRTRGDDAFPGLLGQALDHAEPEAQNGRTVLAGLERAVPGATGDIDRTNRHAVTLRVLHEL